MLSLISNEKLDNYLIQQHFWGTGLVASKKRNFNVGNFYFYEGKRKFVATDAGLTILRGLS